MNSWEELRKALQRPERPEGAKTAAELGAEFGIKRNRVIERMTPLVDARKYDTAIFVISGVRQRCYWPIEVQHGTGRHRARS